MDNENRVKMPTSDPNMGSMHFLRKGVLCRGVECDFELLLSASILSLFGDKGSDGMGIFGMFMEQGQDRRQLASCFCLRRR